MLDFLGGLFSAGTKLLGGILGNNESDKIAAQNVAMQQDFERNGLLYKAQDATNAQDKTGINRLALLGTPTNSFSNIVGDNSLGAGIGDAGQDIGRAVGALAPEKSRAAELENKLLEAKIANVNADTVHQQAVTSSLAKVSQPGSRGVPLPPDDPRGPVINLMQRARDPRTGEIVWIPSEKAASPLQTMAAMPTNASLAGREMTEGLIGYPGGSDSWVPFRGDTFRDMTQHFYRDFGYPPTQ